MEYKYSIKLSGRIVDIDIDTWKTISNYVLSNQWFYVVYMGKFY